MKFHHFLFCLCTLAGACPAADLTAIGYLDVTEPPYSADPTGVNDSTAALQSAIDAARDAGLACFLPPGTYRVTNTLYCAQDDDQACVLVGSTLNSTQRATICLAPSSPGFDDAGSRRLVVYFYNGSPGSEANTTHYHQGIFGIDIRVGSNNHGAAALRLQGAEGTAIEDVTIDLRAGGHTGLWGVPGSGGATHKVTVLGGALGLDTRSYPLADNQGVQPTVVITSLALLNQTDKAAYIRTRGACVGVGWTIVTAQTGPVIHLERHWRNEPFDSSLALIDASIVYSNPASANTVLEMHDRYSRSFHFDNVYVYNAESVWTNGAPANPNGWMHFKRLAVEVIPERPTVTGTLIAVREQVYVEGTNAGGVFCQSQANMPPPAAFETWHGWGDVVPSFESPGAANIKDYGAVGDGTSDDTAAIQAAVLSNEIVFVPKGVYRISNTITLRPDTKLIGVHHHISQLQGLETLVQRFGGNTNAEAYALPMIRTADDAGATTVLAFVAVRMQMPVAQHNPTTVGHYALEWRCGRDSIVRGVEIQPKKTYYYNCANVARLYYGITNPVPECNYPEDTIPGIELWCTKHPVVQVRGNGGGKWFTTFFHGGYFFREDCRVILVDGTSEPLHFYHLHLQQQESAYHAEFRNARNISIYGVKCELKAGLAKFVNCDNVRVIGHGGLGTPDDGHGYEHLYLFTNCANFLISNVGDDIQNGGDNWIGSCWYRWVNATLGSFLPYVEERADGTRIAPDAFDRPIIYLRGDPQFVVPEGGGAAVLLALGLLARRQ